MIDLEAPPSSLRVRPWSDGGLPGRGRVLARYGGPILGRKLFLDGAAMRAWSRHPAYRTPE